MNKSKLTIIVIADRSVKINSNASLFVNSCSSLTELNSGCFGDFSFSIEPIIFNNLTTIPNFAGQQLSYVAENCSKLHQFTCSFWYDMCETLNTIVTKNKNLEEVSFELFGNAHRTLNTKLFFL